MKHALTNISRFLTLKNKGFKYFTLNLISIIIFALLYYLSEIFIVSFPNIAKKYGLGHVKNAYSLDKYLHFSLITQTTVGYGNISADIPNHKSFNNNKLYLLINFIQLLSIIYILAITFQD